MVSLSGQSGQKERLINVKIVRICRIKRKKDRDRTYRVNPWVSCRINLSRTNYSSWVSIVTKAIVQDWNIQGQCLKPAVVYIQDQWFKV
jgi:hypothetical protein